MTKIEEIKSPKDKETILELWEKYNLRDTGDNLLTPLFILSTNFLRSSLTDTPVPF